jgi:hypothetical protein
MVFAGADPQTPWVRFAEFWASSISATNALLETAKKKNVLLRASPKVYADLWAASVAVFCANSTLLPLTLLLLFWKRRISPPNLFMHIISLVLGSLPKTCEAYHGCYWLAFIRETY